MNFPTDTLMSILITLGIALALHYILSVLVRCFGRGGEGILGEIRNAIGKSFPLPMGIAIWIIAVTIVTHKIIFLYFWQDVITFGAGDDVINLAMMISMIRTAILILLCIWFVVRAIRAFAEILNKWPGKKDGINLDTTAIQALASISVVIVWFMGIVVMLQALGMNMSAVITFAGIGGAAFAFASKDVISNFFGGLLVMFNRPFRVGDVIKSGSKVEGKVTRVGLYATCLTTEDGDTIYVPNSIFNSSEIKTITHIETPPKAAARKKTASKKTTRKKATRKKRG